MRLRLPRARSHAEALLFEDVLRLCDESEAISLCTQQSLIGFHGALNKHVRAIVRSAGRPVSAFFATFFRGLVPAYACRSVIMCLASIKLSAVRIYYVEYEEWEAELELDLEV